MCYYLDVNLISYVEDQSHVSVELDEKRGIYEAIHGTTTSIFKTNDVIKSSYAGDKTEDQICKQNRSEAVI